MEKSIVRERLVEAAILAEIPATTGVFKIRVEAIGIHITYIFGVENRPGPYSIDNITSWGAIERANSNPLVLAMTDLLKAARDFKP